MEFEYEFFRQGIRAIAVAVTITGVLAIIFGGGPPVAYWTVVGGIVVLLVTSFKRRG